MQEEAGINTRNQIIEHDPPSSRQRLQAMTGPDFHDIHQTIQNKAKRHRFEIEWGQKHREWKRHDFVKDYRARILFPELPFDRFA